MIRSKGLLVLIRRQHSSGKASYKISLFDEIEGARPQFWDCILVAHVLESNEFENGEACRIEIVTLLISSGPVLNRRERYT